MELKLISRHIVLAVVAAFFAIPLRPASAQSAQPAPRNAQTSEQSDFWSWITGDYSVAVGAAPYLAPRYEGSKEMTLSVMPQFSLGKTGAVTRFSSINDNAAIAILDTGSFQLGPVGKLLSQRDGGTSRDLNGLKTIRLGVEAGVFANLYPASWLRLRAEVRQGIRSHDGLVADFWGDAFADLTPTLRLSGGPRLSIATQRYFDAYYGVDLARSAISGLAVYAPAGGLHSTGFGGALTWKATDRITTSLFAEYTRLLGAAADSTLVAQRGTPDQFLVGVSATYRFDFSIGK